MKRKILLLPLFVVLAFAVAVFPTFSAALSNQTLRNDLAYYRKVSREKNLNVNDRSYILHKIEEKYKGARVSLAPLRAEMKKLNPNEAARPRTSAKDGIVEKLAVVESERDSRIIITVKGVTRYNYFLLRDPEPGAPPEVVLDLFGAKDNLSSRARDIPLKEGAFSRVRAGQFENEPNNVVRVTAELRKESAYRILRKDHQFIIAADKADKQDAEPGKIPAAAIPIAEPAAPAGPPAVVPVALPSPAPVEARADGEDVPVANSAGNATDYYRIGTGDILGITITPAEELSRDAVVQLDGKIPFPLIGSVNAKGLTPRELEDVMEESLNRYVSHPQVSVTLKQFNRRQVFVTGEVRTVGASNYRENLRLMELVSSLGGFSENADRRNIKIFRGPPDKKRTYSVNVEEFIKSGDFSKDFLLEPGDIVEVPAGRSRVAILGDVRTPGYYDYKENLHLLELVSLAGGFTDTARITKVSVLRQGHEKKQAVMKVNLKKILAGDEKDIMIHNGDTVYVPKGAMASANWFVNNILPWLSLVSLVLVIRGGI